MSNEKDKNMTRFLLTFFLGWIGSIIINSTDLRPKGYKSRTLAYFFLSSITGGIYGLVAAISNLSFDPKKESNIGYYRAEDYGQYDYDEDGEDYAPQVKTEYKPTLEDNLKKIVVVASAVMSFLMLFFYFSYETYYVNHVGLMTYGENAFTFFTFDSEFIQYRHFEWAIYLIGALSILFFLISLVLIALSIVNFVMKKKAPFNMPVMIASIAIAVLYMLIGIIFTIINNESYSNLFKTSAYIPLLIQIVLLIAHIVIGKVIKIEPTKTVEIKTPQYAPTPRVKKTTTDDVDQIERLFKLKEMGAITEEDFEQKKKQILGL